VFVGKRLICRSKRHLLTNDNVIVSKNGKRRCLACWWERRDPYSFPKLGFIEEFNRSKATGATPDSVSQLLEWSEKAQQVVKIAEEAVSAAQRLAQRQDVRLCKAKRKVQAAQRRLQQIVQIDHEISVQIDHELSEAWKLPAKQVKPAKK